MAENMFWAGVVLNGAITSALLVVFILKAKLMYEAWRDRDDAREQLREQKPEIDRLCEAAYQRGRKDGNRHVDSYALMVEGYEEEIQELKGRLANVNA